jgi:hypothetical protein
MERLFADGKQTMNVLQFQDHVDGDTAEYTACLDGCREPMPVK